MKDKIYLLPMSPQNPKDPKLPAAEPSLELETYEAPPAEGRASDADGPAHRLAKEARERESEWQQTLKILKEERAKTVNLRLIAWRGFLALGAIGVIYFLSLAFTDPANFYEGAGIFGRNAGKLALTAVFWAGSVWVYARLPSEKQREVRVKLAYGLAVLGAAFLLYLLGFFDGSRRRAWTNVVFLLSFGLQTAAWIFLLRGWKRLQKKIADEDARYVWQRPLLYLMEGLILYLTLGIALQVFAHVDIPAIFLAAMGSLPALGASCFPLAAYIAIRKLASP